MASPAHTSSVLRHLLTDEATSDDLIRWAVQALVDGYDTPALVELASLAEVRLSDAVGPFRQALEDLGIAFPARGQALRAHIRDLANQICSGAIHPRAGARRIHMEALWLLHYPRDLMAWYFLYDGTHYPTHRELVGPELDQLILEEARNLLAEDPASRPAL